MSKLTYFAIKIALIVGIICSAFYVAKAKTALCPPDLDVTAEEAMQRLMQAVSDDDAISCMRLAAKKGLVQQQWALAIMYRMGMGVPRDDCEAYTFARAAAEQGHPEAMALLGDMHGKGECVKPDMREEARWYHDALDHGSMLAIGYEIDQLLRAAGDHEDTSVVVPLQKARDAISIDKLSNMFREEAASEALELDSALAKMFGEALRYTRAAALRGSPIAETVMGLLYSNGPTPNKVEAMAWYRKGAEHGNDFAQNALGAMLWKQPGMPAAFEAVMWWEKSALQGNRDAQYNWGAVLKDLKNGIRIVCIVLVTSIKCLY